MYIELSDINRLAKTAPEAFIEKCEREYEDELKRTAQQIKKIAALGAVVFISGPSASGKTTTAEKLCGALSDIHISSQVISMDNYFHTFYEETAPKNEFGEVDFESPLCIHLELLYDHIGKLLKGDEIPVVQYDFGTRKSTVLNETIRLSKNEITIIEGIHALNPAILDFDNEREYKIFISADNTVVDQGDVVLSPQEMRIIRRLIRDYLFRNATPEFTLGIWANIKRGEEKYINPTIPYANVRINSSFAYEPCVFTNLVKPLFQGYNDSLKFTNSFDKFAYIDPKLVPKNSLLREFIGKPVE